MKATAHQVLRTGSLVRVKNKRGYVVGSILADASNGGKVVLSTVRLTEEFKRGFGQTGSCVKIANAPAQAVSYASITLL